MLTHASDPITTHIAIGFNDLGPSTTKLQLEDSWKLDTLGIHDSANESDVGKALQ